MQTKKRLLICGSSLEFYQYQNPIRFGSMGGFGKSRKKKADLSEDELKAKESFESSIHRAKSKVRRLVECNAWHWKDNTGQVFLPMFMTLTFGYVQTNLTSAHREFMRFIMRLNYNFCKSKKNVLKYVVVVEYQSDIDFHGQLKPQGGSIHYHAVFFNLPYVKDRVYHRLFKLWNENRVELKKVWNTYGVSRYLTKYLSKGMADKRLWGRKRYFISKGLLTPITYYNEQAVSSFERLVKDYTKPYVTNFQSEYLGHVQYSKYTLPKGVEFFNIINQLDDLQEILIDLQQERLDREPFNENENAKYSLLP